MMTERDELDMTALIDRLREELGLGPDVRISLSRRDDPEGHSCIVADVMIEEDSDEGGDDDRAQKSS